MDQARQSNGGVLPRPVWVGTRWSICQRAHGGDRWNGDSRRFDFGSSFVLRDYVVDCGVREGGGEGGLIQARDPDCPHDIETR